MEFCAKLNLDFRLWTLFLKLHKNLQSNVNMLYWTKCTRFSPLLDWCPPLGLKTSHQVLCHLYCTLLFTLSSNLCRLWRTSLFSGAFPSKPLNIFSIRRSSDEFSWFASVGTTTTSLALTTFLESEEGSTFFFQNIRNETFRWKLSAPLLRCFPDNVPPSGTTNLTENTNKTSLFTTGSNTCGLLYWRYEQDKQNEQHIKMTFKRLTASQNMTALLSAESPASRWMAHHSEQCCCPQ